MSVSGFFKSFFLNFPAIWLEAMWPETVLYCTVRYTVQTLPQWLYWAALYCIVHCTNTATVTVLGSTVLYCTLYKHCYSDPPYPCTQSQTLKKASNTKTLIWICTNVHLPRVPDTSQITGSLCRGERGGESDGFLPPNHSLPASYSCTCPIHPTTVWNHKSRHLH